MKQRGGGKKNEDTTWKERGIWSDQASEQATYFGQFGLVLDTFASLLTSG